MSKTINTNSTFYEDLFNSNEVEDGFQVSIESQLNYLPENSEAFPSSFVLRSAHARQQAKKNIQTVFNTKESGNKIINLLQDILTIKNNVAYLDISGGAFYYFINSEVGLSVLQVGLVGVFWSNKIEKIVINVGYEFNTIYMLYECIIPFVSLFEAFKAQNNKEITVNFIGYNSLFSLVFGSIANTINFSDFGVIRFQGLSTYITNFVDTKDIIIEIVNILQNNNLITSELTDLILNSDTSKGYTNSEFKKLILQNT